MGLKSLLVCFSSWRDTVEHTLALTIAEAAVRSSVSVFDGMITSRVSPCRTAFAPNGTKQGIAVEGQRKPAEDIGAKEQLILLQLGFILTEVRGRTSWPNRWRKGSATRRWMSKWQQSSAIETCQYFPKRQKHINLQSFQGVLHTRWCYDPPSQRFATRRRLECPACAYPGLLDESLLRSSIVRYRACRCRGAFSSYVIGRFGKLGDASSSCEGLLCRQVKKKVDVKASFYGTLSANRLSVVAL